MKPSNPHVESYDLVIRTKNDNDNREYWHWRGSPMAEVSVLQARLKRERKLQGDRLTGYKIVLQDLDQTTGNVSHKVIEEG